MSKSRVINTRFWDDNYTSNLDPIEKLMFLYFLTNTSTNISGIYEIPIKKIANETGIDKEMVLKIIDRFTKDKKIFYHEGWVCVRNFIKNQNQRSPKVIRGIEIEITAIPQVILNKMIEYGYPMDTVSHSNSNSNSNIDIESKTKVLQTIEDYINANFELKEKYNTGTEEMTNWYINKKTGQGMSYASISKKFNELQEKEKTKQKANEKRAETMSTLNLNAVKMLKDLQGIQSLDGKENFKSADSVIKKIRGDMIARHQVVSDNEIDMLIPLQNLLEEIKEKSPFHWKNLTSYNYLDKWFNKIVIEIYGK